LLAYGHPRHGPQC